MCGARLGEFEDLMLGLEPQLGAIARRLRDLLLAVHPYAVEVVRLGDQAATYGVGPRKMIEGYAYIMPQRDHVNLGFYRGTALSDPAGRLEGTGKAMRHVKLRAPDEVDDPGLRELVAAAVAERTAARSQAGG